jgi:hypothetical protein
MRGNMIGALLMAFAFAAMLVGSGIAQGRADNPPGSQFQNQGERQDIGRSYTPSRFSRTAHHARGATKASKPTTRASAQRHKSTQNH